MFDKLVIGLKGTRLMPEERRWLKEHPPKGVILFARNIESPEQVKSLLADAREASESDLWVAIDEEGGRVNRLPWEPFNCRVQAADYGKLFLSDPEGAIRQVYNDSYEIGLSLKELGFTHNCAPVLDLFNAEGHAIIGDRAYGDNSTVVVELGAACMRGLHDAGIEAIGKHFPGHGRANADSHVAVPEVDISLEEVLAEAESFKRLFAQGLKHVMTAHVIYSAKESRVATLSDYWMKDILREQFNFTGDVWSDDLCMKGVGGDIHSAADDALKAGCDWLLVCEPDGVEQFYKA
ncbi:MAG: beta-N-acetylhexosaminidase [Mariprofundaceae bacterium]